MTYKYVYLLFILLLSSLLVACSDSESGYQVESKVVDGIKLTSKTKQKNSDIYFAPVIENVSDETIVIKYAVPIAFYKIDTIRHPSKMRDLWEEVTLKPGDTVKDISSIYQAMPAGDHDSTVEFRYMIDGKLYEETLSFQLNVK